jgi:tricorn protease
MPLMLAAMTALATAPGPYLFQHPTTNGEVIVFAFAGDLWSVPVAGGNANRLTTSEGQESSPYFSPDGKTIAFTGQYDGNTDVFTIPAGGGVPQRLTAHPSADNTRGWSADGTQVLYSSSMLSNTDYPRLFTVSVKGGIPKPLPLPTGTMGSFSPDGKQLAYVPRDKWQPGWKRYRGGQTYPIWIADLATSKVKEIPRQNTNDEQPMWIGDRIYFVSDRKITKTLYSYDPKSNGVVEELPPAADFDLKSATAGTGSAKDKIVFEKLGGIHVFDVKTKRTTEVPVSVTGDFPEVRTEFKDISAYVQDLSLSPTGARVAVTARGFLVTVPAAKGDFRVLDETPGIHRRSPAWSPDGTRIAYLTDVRNGYQLAIKNLADGAETIYPLGNGEAFWYSPVWSPDGNKIAITNNKHELWVHDARNGTGQLVDTGTYEDPQTSIVPNWSPDSKWLTWSRDLNNHLNAVFVFDLEKKVRTQITDGMANAKNPVFDRDGRHLYFHASTDTGWGASYLDMTSLSAAPPTSFVYAIVLKKDGANPLFPESDEEPNPDADKAAKKEEPKDTKFRIDLENIESRIVQLPLPRRSYISLETGPAGSFFTIGGNQVTKFDVNARAATPFGSARGLSVSAKGDKMLVAGFSGFQIVSTAAPFGPGQGAINLNGLRVKFDPRAEWNQMFNELFRNERIFFYDAGLHGANMAELKALYAPFIPNIHSRSDLNYLFEDIVGHLSIGHMWVRGGDTRETDKFVPGGLLGADFEFSNGKYRLTRIFDGERWNPGLRAPLAQPGINAKVGEYILEIDGKPLDDSLDIYLLLEGKAGRQVKVKLGPTPDGKDSRVVTVIPTPSEFGLRFRAWAEDNRRYVAKMTNGRAAYVHVPDTGDGGWQAFQRYYLAQSDKDAAIIDERFNHGGLINDYMVHEMQRTLSGVFTPRNGKDWPTPGLAIFGPKVMLANELSGSGGDMFPWLFKYHKIGPVIGKRTWGGLVRAFGFDLVDGGSINAPDVSFYNPHNGTWDVEGYGVAPDIDVEFDPYLWRQGKDAQLERAIAEINKGLATYKPLKLQRPPSANKKGKGSDGY